MFHLNNEVLFIFLKSNELFLIVLVFLFTFEEAAMLFRLPSLYLVPTLVSSLLFTFIKVFKSNIS